MAIEKLISSDSHIVEPPDLWEKRIDPKFRDRAPRLVWTGETDRWYVDKDTPAGPGGGMLSEAGKRYYDRHGMKRDSSFEEVRPGAYDPHPRIKDLEVDGVVGEILIPTVADRFYGLPVETDLLSAIFRAMNDWMVDFCKPYPDIFKGIGLINVDDAQDALKEYNRCVKMGLAGVMIPTFPGEDRLYDLPEYDPLWARAQADGVPLVMHSGTVRGEEHLFAATAMARRGAGALATVNEYWARRSIGNMIFGGVFERYPGLKLGVIEYEIGWAPYQMRRWDNFYTERQYSTEIQFKDGKLPSDFFRSSVFVNFSDDDAGITYRSLLGVDNVVWGSDFPHRESTWPRSREVLSEMFEGKGVSEEDQQKIAYLNVAKLFNFSV